MTVLKHVTAAAVLGAALLSVAPAQAFSAKQASAQGQGMFVTSSGAPQNMVSAGPAAPQANDANKRPLRTHQHDRYFAGF